LRRAEAVSSAKSEEEIRDETTEKKTSNRIQKRSHREEQKNQLRLTPQGTIESRGERVIKAIRPYGHLG